MGERVASCVWPVSEELLLALDERFGEPVDSYVNGAQVWIRDDGPNGATLEWRLHPVARFERPRSTGVYDLLETVVYALRMGEEPPAPIDSLWDGLEAFPGYGDEVEPAPLAAACAESLGLQPEAFGIADHETIADDWERTTGGTSVISALRAQFETT
jgi:hypothetical protein